jgi:hypothetical protein
VLLIRISFNADPDPAFRLNADPDQGSQTNADPDQILSSLKVEFLPYFIGIRYKSLFEELEIDL